MYAMSDTTVGVSWSTRDALAYYKYASDSCTYDEALRHLLAETDEDVPLEV